MTNMSTTSRCLVSYHDNQHVYNFESNLMSHYCPTAVCAMYIISIVLLESQTLQTQYFAFEYLLYIQGIHKRMVRYQK